MQDGRERRDLIPLGRCGDLPQRDRGAVGDGREQVHPGPVRPPRTAGGLAVHRDGRLMHELASGGDGPGAQDRVQDVRVDPGQHPGERRRRGRGRLRTETSMPGEGHRPTQRSPRASERRRLPRPPPTSRTWPDLSRATLVTP